MKLERAKLLHNVGKSAEAKSQILQLIKKDPENENYWVYLHIFTKNSEPNISKQALFKAYETNLSSSFVLNSLISFYFENKEFGKFFKALQVAQKLNHMNPHVISILTILNTKVGINANQNTK